MCSKNVIPRNKGCGLDNIIHLFCSKNFILGYDGVCGCFPLPLYQLYSLISNYNSITSTLLRKRGGDEQLISATGGVK